MLSSISFPGLIGTVFDVTRKADVYGAGRSYNVFAGKDGSKGLGMSSLKIEDAVPDYSVLNDADMKTLNDWHSFFSYVPTFMTSSSHQTYHVGNGTISSGAWWIFLLFSLASYLTVYCCLLNVLNHSFLIPNSETCKRS